VEKVAFQGERGAYSEEAVRALHGDAVQPVPKASFALALDALESGEVQRAVLPVENSLGGAVIDVHDLLVSRDFSVAKNPQDLGARRGHEFRVEAELELRIRHCLLAPVGFPAEELRTVHSHPQALAQCAHFIAQRGLTPVVEYDTAGSALKLAEGKLPPGAAAIASRVAAKEYGLSVLATNLETRGDNATRFFSLVIGPHAPAAAQPETGRATVIFSPRAGVPGLAACLTALGGEGLLPIRVEARPARVGGFRYFFWVELEGARAGLERSLEKLAAHGEGLRLLGWYGRGSADPGE
jgi:prephenate dehydratase